jgi:hypothetical protein
MAVAVLMKRVQACSGRPPLLTAVTDLYRGSLGIVEDIHTSGKTVYPAVVLSSTPVAAL